MGRKSSFLVRRSGPTWVHEEQSQRPVNDLAGLAGEGPSMAARALHSDVCYVLGRAPGTKEWRWVFGEGSAAAYAEEFDPSGWIMIDDPDVLEESRDERIAAATAAVITWAVAAGVEAPTRQEVSKVLAAGYVFAEEGFFALLDALGIDAPIIDEAATEQPGPTDVWHDVAPKRPRKPDPPRAIAIDRSSPAWTDVNAYDLEFRFGEPPCILRWERNDYVLSDPPVAVLHGLGDEFGGEWVDVPPQHAADFLTAAAWARTHVGGAGEPPTGSRPALVIDDPHPARDGYSELPLSQLYERADPAQVLLRLELELEKPLDRDVAADLASSFYDRLVTGTVASLGESATVTYGSEESEESWGLVVGGMTSRKNGHIGLTKATEAAWSRVVSKLRSGELTSAEFWITRTDAFGRGNWQSFSHLSASFSIWREAYEDKESPPRVLAISVDLPYFHEMFRPADAAAFARSALASLPVRRGFVHVGRWAHSTDHWIDILPASEVSHPSDYAITENHGQLLWLQRTADAPTPIVEI